MSEFKNDYLQLHLYFFWQYLFFK